jgi:N-terminal domain of toast_rack, DUF2154/Domain of unknown function (DUF5668)
VARDRGRTSLVFPILLITFGALFLYAQRHPEFDPWPMLRTWWPLLLVFIGLGKIWDYTQDRRVVADMRARSAGGSPGTIPRRSNLGATIGVLACVLVVALLLWHGGGRARARGFGAGMRHDVKTVDLQGAKTVRGVINMSAGDLTVSGDSSHLLDASFDYRVSDGVPQVEYRVSGDHGDLTIDESDVGTRLFTGGNHTAWNLHFGDQAPLDLEINMGAGEGKLRLRDVPVTRLDLSLGAGRVEADLTGNRKDDLLAEIKGGVGEAIIRLPHSVGVIVNASGGIGSVDAHGLKHDGDTYTNDAYGHTPSTVHLTVQGGIGHIQLTEEVPR